LPGLGATRMMRWMARLDVPNSGGASAGDAGIRTFLIADVRGYTLFAQERGDEAAGKLAARFADIAGEIVESQGGILLELRGDEALCVFASARDGIRAAIALQRRFVEETLAMPEFPLTVGIGLDAGEAVRVGDGYRGGALNLAARLCGQARAGEILGSREVTHLARAIEGVRYEGRGEMRFKNLSDPVSVVRIVATDGDAMQQLRPFAAKPPRPGRRSRTVLAAVACILVVALVAIGIPLLSSDGATAPLGANTLSRLDAEDGSVDLAFDIDLQPGEMAIGFDSAWVVEPDRNRVVRLRLTDGSVADTIAVGRSPSGIAVGDGAVWVTNAVDGTVDRIDVETNAVSQTLPAGSSPEAIAVGAGSLWVADRVGAALLRIDPVSGDAVPVELDGLPSGVAFTPEGVWVTLVPGGLVRVDGDRVTLDKAVGQGPSAITYAFGSIWVADELEASVTRVDPSTGKIRAAVPVGEGPTSLADAGGRLWVSSPHAGSLAAIDPASDSVASTIPVEGEAASLAAGGGDLWLGIGPSSAEHRGGTLHVSAGQQGVPTLDPPLLFGDAIGWQVLSMTNDGLVAYRKVGGPDGLTIVPDLASALPEISDDGLTYRFAVRDDVVYSNGDPVRPEDFRRALERSIALSDARYYFGAILGADECREPPKTCDLSQGIEVGEDSVTFHLAVPDGDLLFKLALPFAFAVPADTPIEDVGYEPVPATGPYEITHASDKGLELGRNPRFREWSAAAQRDGYADAISIEFGEHNDAFDRVAAGDLDVMLAPPDPEDLAVARAEFPARIFEANAARTVFVGFDVTRRPFDDKRVRQALSYALDRDRIVDVLGGAETQRATCQILPPSFQGYTPYCPFTRDPGAEWSGPDVDRGRELVEQAGAAGQPVGLSISEDYYPGAAKVMEEVRGALNEIGLEATLEILPQDRYLQNAFTPPGSPQHPQVLSYTWFLGFPGASEFLAPQFGCGENFNVTGYCEPAVDRRMEEAKSLQISDPGSANRAWSDIEHDLVDDAALVPVANPILTFVVSERAGNVQINPQFGVLLGQMWVA
jgi:peptide/nickel transport system substrate-binding protein